jgi:hypothetical protein
MKTKSGYFVVFLICVSMIGYSATVVFAKKNACGKEMTAAEMAEHALDGVEIQNAMAMHQLLGAPGGDHDLELATIWAQKTPGVTFAHNVGIVTGIEAIRKYYGTGKGYTNDPKKEQTATPQGMMQAGAGNISFRTLTTPIIHIAGDGKTAKAYWYTPGFQANIQNGQGNAIWSYEKYAIDFVKEDGAWKIWHFHVYNDWEIPMGKDLAQYVLEQKKSGGARRGGAPAEAPGGDRGGAPGSDGGSAPAGDRGGVPGLSGEVAKAYKGTVFGQPYSADKVPNNLKSPRPPEAYCTFSDTFSYADE